LLHSTEKQIEKQLGSLFLQAPIGFSLAIGPDFVMELANKEFLRLTGRTEDIIGKPIIEVFTEIETQGYLALLQKVVKNKETIYLNESLAVILIDGVREPLYINTVLQPYFDGEEAVGVLSILTDVTKYVLSRKKIEESEERLRLATETTKLGTWEYLPLTGELTWSDECKKIYQFPLDKEVDYALFSELIFPDDKEFAESSIQKAMDPSGSGEYNIEYRILRYSDKSVRWIRAQGKVFFTEEKKPLRFIGTVLDITDAKVKEETLRINEERLRLAVESGRLGTYELDIPNSSIIFSPRLAEIFGLDPTKKGTHQDLKNALHPDDVHIRNEAHELAKKTGSLFYEARVIWPDRSVHWIRLNGKVLFDNKGKALRTYGTALEITEQKEKERILKESEDKLRLITDAVPHMVWEIELDGTISYINKQWEDWSGLTLEEINQGGWSKVFHPEDAEKVGKGWMEAFQNQKIYLGECRIKNPQGGYSWFTLKTVPVKNNNGEVALWIGTATDIHDKKIAEQQKDEFLNIASHELKTPVTSLKGFTQILQMKFEKEGNDLAVGLLSKMDKQVDKLTKLIVDLLDATKIENGQLKLTKEDFDFNELVAEIVEEMQRTTDNQKIITKLSATTIINGDKNRIGQVITNLISNAIKYSPKSGEIIVFTLQEKNNVKLCVQDFGIGISIEKQPKIFDRFFRVSGQNQDTYPGLGLGLYISSEIIKRHKGKISVESVPDKGSTFCFTLPVKAT
jgi:PAS domain S-box-containing protein